MEKSALRPLLHFAKEGRSLTLMQTLQTIAHPSPLVGDSCWSAAEACCRYGAVSRQLGQRRIERTTFFLIVWVRAEFNQAESSCYTSDTSAAVVSRQRGSCEGSRKSVSSQKHQRAHTGCERHPARADGWSTRAQTIGTHRFRVYSLPNNRITRIECTNERSLNRLSVRICPG